MLTIRLARTGKRNSAKFKIMLQEKGAAPGGKHIEILGSHDPHLKKTVLKGERIKYWLSKGTQVSDTAHNLFVKNELIADKKRPVKLPKKVVEVAAVEAEKAPEAEKKEDTAVVA
jgi:small subunit ribosomal protein S16